MTDRRPAGSSECSKVATRRPDASYTERSTLAAAGSANSMRVADEDGFGLGADSSMRATGAAGGAAARLGTVIRNALRVYGGVSILPYPKIWVPSGVIAVRLWIVKLGSTSTPLSASHWLTSMTPVLGVHTKPVGLNGDPSNEQ